MFLSACAAPPSIAHPVTPERAIRRTPITTWAGTETELTEISRGKVTVVALWATWCEACLVEMPALARLDAASRARGDFLVVAVAVGARHGDVSPLVARGAIAVVPFLDPEGAFADSLGSRSVPSTLVLDGAGNVVFRGGALDAEALHAIEEATR